ncbi:hypothetical protein JCM8202v2_003270 [Rhodotorula sphaerocarpa]
MIPEDRSGTSTPASSSSQASAERPAHHVVHPITGSLTFKNPWPSASAPTASELLFGGSWLGWPKVHLNKHPKARELKVLETGDFGRAKVRELKQEARDMGKGDKVGFARATWLGHAGMYVQIPLETPVDPVAAFRARQREGNEQDQRAAAEVLQEAQQEGSTLHLLFDPIFSERAGPTSYTGPGRIRPSPCTVADLPQVDAVLISHNHYDHLDANTVKSLIERFPRAHYFVPLGNKPWFNGSGVPLSQLHECDWWDHVELEPSDFGIGPTRLASPFPAAETAGPFGPPRRESSRSQSLGGGQETTDRIRFTCVPAQHNSGRSPGDQGSTLWCGWVVEYLIESDTPNSQSFAPAEKSSSRNAPADGASRAMSPPPVLVEEPEELSADSAVNDGDDGETFQLDRARSTSPSTRLDVPRAAPSPDANVTPNESLSDLSLDANESVHSDDSKSQLVSRRLSLSRSKDNPSSESLVSTPTGEATLSEPARPPMSRSNSLRIARETQRERERETASLGVPPSNPDGTRSAPAAPEAGLSLDSDDPEVRERMLRDTEAELVRVREDKKRVRAARQDREEEERIRALREGRWTKRVMRKGAIFHAGDTGYRRHRRCAQPVCPAFDEIGLKFGPFDLSFLPIWRGGSLGFVSAIGLRLHHENISSAVHGCPGDAVDIHLDVRSRNSIGMHFGTFIGAESESLEAIIELAEAIEDAGVKPLDDPNEDELGRMGVIDVGETWCTEIHPLLIVH